MRIDATLLAAIAVVLSAVAILLTAFGLRQKAGKDYTDSLHTQLEDCCRRVKECETDRLRLRVDVTELMRRLLHLENGS